MVAWGLRVWWPGDYEYGGLGTRSMVAWGLGLGVW